MSLLDNLPHTCSAYTRKRVKDGMGGTKEDFSTEFFTGRSCWRQGASDTEITEFEKKGQKVTHKVYFTTNPGLNETHLLVIGSDEMLVRSAADPDASVGLGILYRVMVEMTTTGSTR